MQKLIITSSGGRGHLILAQQQRQYFLDLGIYEADIFVIDLMGVDETIAQNSKKPWVPSYGIPGLGLEIFSGEANTRLWNATQKKGGMNSIRKLEFLSTYQSTAEIIQNPSIRRHLEEFIRKNPDLDEMVDTQALSTSIIAQVVTAENSRRSLLKPPLPKIKYRKLISEFFTREAKHFLKPLSLVRREDSACLSVEIVNEPILAADETIADFYRKNGVSHIKFKKIEAPVRKEFLNPSYRDEHVFFLKVSPDEKALFPVKEYQYTQKKLEGMDYEEFKNNSDTYFKFKKTDDLRLITLSLGSQGSQSILSYVDVCIKEVLAEQPDPVKKILFVILAGINDGSYQTLYAMVRHYIEERMLEIRSSGMKWPSSVVILPLAIQDERSMASLFLNTDVLLTRSGGLSSFELKVTQEINPSRRVGIHSEAIPLNANIFPINSFDASVEFLKEGMVTWEWGNAMGLSILIGASLITPETMQFNSFSSSLLNLALCRKLNAKNYNLIFKFLAEGANPNLDSIQGPPIMDCIEDYKILNLFIEFGGRLNKSMLTNFKELDENARRKIINREHLVQSFIKNNGYPPKLRRIVFDILKSESLDKDDYLKIQGILYRFPKLANQILVYLDLDLDLKKSLYFEKIHELVLLVAGISPIKILLDKAVSFNDDLKQRLFFLRAEFNKQDNDGFFPLQYAASQDLRCFMVHLGANPYLLHSKSDFVLNEWELLELKTIYSENQKKIKLMATAILKVYHETENYEHFCEKFEALMIKEKFIDFNFDDSFYDLLYSALEMTSGQIKVLSLYEWLVNLVREYFSYIFGADLLTKTAVAQSENWVKWTFFSQEIHSDAALVDEPVDRRENQAYFF